MGICVDRIGFPVYRIRRAHLDLPTLDAFVENRTRRVDFLRCCAVEEFALTDITAVTFHLKLHSPFWRPAYMIFLQLENAEHRILIPNALPSPALPTRRMLAANFKDKYSELAL